MSTPKLPLGEVTSIPVGPITPQKYPHEWFLLYSLPAFDSGMLEKVQGHEIKSSKTLIKHGDVLVSKLNPRIPRVWHVSHQLGERAICSTEFIPFRPKDIRKLDSEFLSFILSAPQFIGELAKEVRSSTGSHQRVRPNDIQRKSIPVPPLSEQRRIVARIKECMERVEEIERLRSDSKGESAALSRSYYSEIYRDLLVRSPTRKLAEVGSVSGGGTPSKQNAEFWKGSIPWISPKDMKKHQLSDASLHISRSAIAGSAAKLIPAQSVLFVVRGMILIHTLPVAVNEVSCAINQDMKAITPESSMKADFLATMLRGAEQTLLSKVEIAGHGTRRLQTHHWANLPVPTPSISEQEQILEVVREFENAVSQLKGLHANRDSTHLRDAILRKAFAGEL